MAKTRRKKSRRKGGVAVVLAETASAERVDRVFRWILEGKTEFEVATEIHREWPSVAARPLIAQAVAVFCKAGEFDGVTVRGWCFEAARDLYRRMMETQDLQGALRAVKLVDDLAKRG